VEGSVPHPRNAKSIVLFVFLTSAAVLISGIVTASPNPSKQQGHLIPEQPSHKYEQKTQKETRFVRRRRGMFKSTDKQRKKLLQRPAALEIER
jgi:hypothetical protein